MKYAVRCCCQPRKVFGYLELPAGLRDGQRLPILPRLSAIDYRVADVAAPVPIETILMRTFSQRGAIGEDGRLEWSTELAVYSEDRPEEFWRALPNFTPLPPHPHWRPVSGQAHEQADEHDGADDHEDDVDDAAQGLGERQLRKQVPDHDGDDDEDGEIDQEVDHGG